MAWKFGTYTIQPKQSQRYWLAWGGYPGFEVIGVQPINPGSELDYTNPGVQMNNDGSTTYFITVINVGPYPVEFHLTGNAI